MKIENHNIPDYQDLVRLNRKLFLKYALILFTLIIFDIYSIYYFISSEKVVYGIFCIFAILISLFFSLSFFSGFLDKNPVKIDEYKLKKIGHFSKEELKNMIGSIFQEFKNTELPTIYIIKDKLSSPCTIDTYIFNFAKNVNAIYLPEYVFFILNAEELKSVILHEIAHFKKYMLPSERFIFPLMFFIFIAPIYLYYFLNLYFFIPVYIITIFILFINQNKIFYEKHTTHEYLSDFFSAQRVGVLNYINGLIAGIRYNEAMEYISKRILRNIKKDKKLSVKMHSRLLEEIVPSIPIKTYSKRKISKILEEYMTSNKIKEFYENLDDKQIKKENEIIDSMLTFNFMCDDIESADWKEFDKYKVNKRIEEEEYDDFINYILNNKDKVLFRESNEDEFSAIMDGYHPLLRNRILFLHQNKHYIEQ